MQLNSNTVKTLINGSGITQNQLAENIGISKGYLSNSLSGKRGAGRKLLAGLIRQFPEQSVSSLTSDR